MNPTDLCPECGKPLPATSQHKLCPACLMAQAIASQTVEGARGGSAPIPEPDEIAGKFPQFEILECLGRGGMGVVYKARQKSLNRLVAIKILAPERGHDARFAGRFASEAELLAKLSHPRIVTIHDFGETGGLYYLVMEFVDGVNLRDLLREGKLEPKQALAIVPEICDALQFAHDHGIIHRDIKPENILLDRLERVKVADFGLAKLIGPRNEAAPGTEGAGGAPNLTEAGKIMGTPSYMAPEQTTHPDAVDHRADIYALGVVFYQMLTGELPGKDLEAPSRKVRIDVRLDEVVLRALEKNPDLRYSQASILKTQVETIAESPAPLTDDSGPWVQSRGSTWFGSPLQQEIWTHMSAREKRESTIRGLMFSIWNLATWFLPISIVLLSHDFARWIYAALVLGVGLACFPVWWKIILEGQCSTAWARERGYTPDQLRKAANAIAAPRWLRIGGAAALFVALYILDFIAVPAMGWPKPNSTIVSFILSFGLVFACLYCIQRFRRMHSAAASTVNTPEKQSPSGGGLLALGVLSLLLGPVTAIPGLLLSRRFRPFTATATVGYFLCWFGLVMTVAATTLFLLRAKSPNANEAHSPAMSSTFPAVDTNKPDNSPTQLAESKKGPDSANVNMVPPATNGTSIAGQIKATPAPSLADAAPSEQMLAAYDWPPVSGDDRSHERLVNKDGRKALMITNTNDTPLQLSLLTIEKPAITSMHYALAGEIRYEDVQGAGYLEMWNDFPQGRFFSRTLGATGSGPMGQIAGTSSWRTFSLPFDSTGSAAPPSRLELNIFLPGRGVAYISPVKLTQIAQAKEQPAVSPVTVAETRELEGDVGRLYHAIVYTQTSAVPPKLGPASYQFIADMSNNTFPVTSTSVSLPAGSAWATNPVAVASPDSLFGAHYLFVQGFKSEADLMANFPNGSYAFNVQSGGAGAATYAAPVSFTGSVPYPPIAPVITNTTWDSDSLVLDPASAAIHFTNYPGATLTWEIFIPGRTYIMSAGGGGTSLGALNLTGILTYGQTYEAQLRFINRDTSSTVSDPNAPKDYGYSTMVAQIVEFKIKTPAGPAAP